MTKDEVIKEFYKKTVLPITTALMLFSVFSQIFTGNCSINLFFVWLAVFLLALARCSR